MEEWKDVKGYEGLYQVSNFGRVKNKQTGKFKKLAIRSDGYVVTQLYKNNIGTNKYIHRLVMENFTEDYDETVNHIDGNKQNNNLNNLEWMSYRDNNLHAIKTGLNTTEHKRNCKGSIKVAQYSSEGELIKVYPSMRQAERETNVDATAIGHGIRKGWKYGGYIWKYA